MLKPNEFDINLTTEQHQSITALYDNIVAPETKPSQGPITTQLNINIFINQMQNLNQLRLGLPRFRAP